MTREWWKRRIEFEIYVSQQVVVEAGAGDSDAAQARLVVLQDLPNLAVTADAYALATRLVEAHAIPEAARIDALHVALAAVNGMDYLLTWNCRHIANAEMRDRIERTIRQSGYEPPIICTPEELME